MTDELHTRCPLCHALRLLDALDALLETWDDSADSLGPEWNGLAKRIKALAALRAGRDNNQETAG